MSGAGERSNVNALSDVVGVKEGSTPGASTKTPEASLQRIENVRLEIYKQGGMKPGQEIRLIAYLKIRDNTAIIVTDFLPELLREIARTILAWEVVE